MIVLKDVSKVYRIGENEIRALDHASLHVKKGEFVSVVGPSGSGKSTMMNIIGCMDTADSGQYLFEGQPIGDYTERELTMLRSRKIGVVFQNFNLIENMTAAENIELPLVYQRVPKKERKERVLRVLDRVGLAGRGEHRPNELSGGQQQRVAIARALVAEPSLILADEPTGNLDSATGKEIMKLFCELHEQGNTVMLITHDDHVAGQAERIFCILDGKVEEKIL